MGNYRIKNNITFFNKISIQTEDYYEEMKFILRKDNYIRKDLNGIHFLNLQYRDNNLLRKENV